MVAAFSGANNAIMTTGATFKRNFTMIHIDVIPIRRILVASTTIVRRLGVGVRLNMAEGTLISVINFVVIHLFNGRPRIDTMACTTITGCFDVTRILTGCCYTIMATITATDDLAMIYITARHRPPDSSYVAGITFVR